MSISEQLFMHQIQELKGKLPLSEDEIAFEYKQTRKYALEEFRKRVMGDDFQQFIDELKKTF